MYKTHEVTNQSHSLENVNLFQQDQILKDILLHLSPSLNLEALNALGKAYGSKEVLHWGHLSNQFPPQFYSHDNYGHRIDYVEYHPSYHQLMKMGIEAGITVEPWIKKTPDAFILRAAKMFLHSQVEQGTQCPMTMTFSVVPALMHDKQLSEQWLKPLLKQSYDQSFQHWKKKKGLTFGMAMTEKQGGSDVRTNTTTAKLVDPKTRKYNLVGHKWFCSAPMSDAFLMLAQSEKALSCFLVPRFKEDETLNSIQVQRLKNKLGNRSNASSEIELKNAEAYLLGEEGQGVRVIIEMVALTRIDCMLGSAAIMRQALSQAIHHCTNRKAFGDFLVNQELMKNVLADLSLEAEASMWLAFRSVQALSDPKEGSLKRIITAIGKFWICKRATYFTHEAQECLGGLGYIEDHVLPRLYREAPVNSIWEGSGNIQCLDVLRALSKEPETLNAFLSEVKTAEGLNSDFDQFIDQKLQQALKTAAHPSQARVLTETMAKALQGSLLLRYAPSFVAKAWVDSRIKEPGQCFGSLDGRVDFKPIIDRAAMKN